MRVRGAGEDEAGAVARWEDGRSGGGEAAGMFGVAEDRERVGQVDVTLLLAVPEPGVGPLLAAESCRARASPCEDRNGAPVPAARR